MQKENDLPLVSIIIAAYNAELYIKDCLESLVAQTYHNIEIWICDDASTDETYDICKEYSKKYSYINVVRNEKNKFAGYSRNRCIYESKGKYIAIQDADDVCSEDRIEKLVKAISKHKCDFVSSAHYLFDENGKYSTYYPKEVSPTKQSFLSGMPFCHAATLFTKECLVDVKGYRQSDTTIRNEDYDMFMRLYAKGYQGYNLDDVLYGYRVDKNTLKRRTWKFRMDECRVRFYGYKEMGILFPIGWIYGFRPLIAYFVQLLTR